MNRIYTLIPYCHEDEGIPVINEPECIDPVTNKPKVRVPVQGYDLGAAYNRCMAVVPDGDWACFLDHDAWFTTKGWHRQIEAAIAEKPDAGMFTGRCNNLNPDRSAWQMLGPVDAPVSAYREIGREIQHAFGTSLRDITDEEDRGGDPVSGFCMIIPKAVWTEIGCSAHGFRSRDHKIHKAIAATGRRIYLIEGLYLYHLWDYDEK